MNPPLLGKMEIAKLLREKRGIGPFLEISTPTTGNEFAEIMDHGKAPHGTKGNGAAEVHRLVYNCPNDVDDGLTYTYRTEAPTSAELTAAILAANQHRPRYDFILVDPYHSYASSSIDLSGAFSLLRPDGIMLVHDCNPETAALAAPEFVRGEWCGVTYMAFIDFTLRRAGLSYYTVDTDFGCGIIHKHRPRPKFIWNWRDDARSHACDYLASAWAAARHNEATRFEFFAQHRRDLLNLKTIDEFYAQESLSPATKRV